jgi:hypothetical protein
MTKKLLGAFTALMIAVTFSFTSVCLASPTDAGGGIDTDSGDSKMGRKRAPTECGGGDKPKGPKSPKAP